MKAKFIKGTTLRGKAINGGDVLDLDEQDFRLFVHLYKDAVPFNEPVAVKAAPVFQPSDVVEIPVDDKKAKGKK